MSKDIFDDPNDLGFDDLGRINDEGFVEVETPADNPVLFEDQFEMRSRELQAAPRGMQTVDIFPTKKGPWTGNNQLGIHQGFAPDSNNRQTILKLDEWGFPEIWTLCLGLDFDHNNWPDTIDIAADFDITALIQFGIGGVVQEVEIDWHNGTAISLPMNALNVIAHYNLPLGGGEGPGPSQPPENLILRASVSRGTLFQCLPTRTFYIEEFPLDIDGQSAAVIDIPPFSKSVTVVSTMSDPTDVFTSYTLPGNQVQFRTDIASNIPSGFLIETHALSQFVEYLSIVDSTIGRPVPVDIPTGARSLMLSVAPFVQLIGQSFRVTFQIGV